MALADWVLVSPSPLRPPAITLPDIAYHRDSASQTYLRTGRLRL